MFPPAAPLTISTLSVAGWRWRSGVRARRVALSFIGDGGSSLGEWHEAINLSPAPAAVVFCIQNNQTALSTPVADQTAVRVFADKAVGTACRASRSTEPIPTRSRQRSRGRSSVRAPARAGAHRARVHAHVRPCAPRRHALPRARSAPLVGIPGRDRARLRRLTRAVRSARDPIGSMPDGWRPRASSLGRPGRFHGEAQAIVEAEARALVDAPWPEPGPPAPACSPTKRRASTWRCWIRRSPAIGWAGRRRA